MPAKKEILLAVADTKLRKRIKVKVLEDAGYAVMAVGSCKAARASLEKGKLALCFLGDDLPDGDPFELAEEFLMKRPKLPIVLIAGKDAPGQLLRGMRIGISDCLAPPHKANEVLASVERGLQQRQLRESWLNTETKRKTSPLDKRLGELEEILRRVDDGVLLLDSENKVVMVNEALRQAFAVEEQEVLGSGVDQLFRDEDILQALEEDGDEGHTEISAKDGRVFSMQVTQIPDVGRVASLHDITYLKDLDRLKGDFVNTVSHDLRSPLTAILGYVELIERAGEVNEQQAQFIDRVKASVASTTDLIEDLLNLGRLEVGVVDDMRELQLGDLVESSLDAHSSFTKQKEITVRYTPSKNIPTVMGSRTQLRQVADNLIGNAVKYTYPGGEIRVSLSFEDGQVILRVADNGPGIPANEHKSIFEKFYRAKNVNEGVEGTGLGLAIVKTVVDNHGGRIWVESKPKQGSVFTVVLPVAEISDNEVLDLVGG
jgi:PAS domain S-box-containing protein